MIYGYARVSTDGQTVGAQVEALTTAGAAKMFRETASGALTDRAQLRKALAALEAGDLLMVTRLDPRPAEHPRRHCRPQGGIPLARGRVGGHDNLARTGEGRARAVARGVKMGHKPKLTPHQVKEVLRRKADGEAVREIARSYNVHNNTISRLPV